ncbi:unnamed protein product, partial [marine sediment metagenome]
ITNAALDRMYQVSQRGAGALVGAGERVPMPIEGLGLRASMRSQYGSNWGGRMVNNQSNTAIRTDDIDTGYRQVERLVRNAGMEPDSMLAKTSEGRVIEAKSMDELTAQLVGKEKIVGKVHDVDHAMYSFSQLSNGNGQGAFRAMREVYDSIALKMEMDGIPEPFIRAVTSMVEEMGATSKFFTDAVGETGKYPGVGFMSMVDGKAAIQPGPQLIYEMFSGSINVPDPRLLRRTLAETGMIRRQVNMLTTQKKIRPVLDGDSGLLDFGSWKPRGDLDDRAALKYARLYISNIWKPMKLLRFGYIPKVVLGDEQARMTAAGLSSMWAPGRITKGDSPIAYLSYLLGRKRGAKAEDVTGSSMAAARQYKDTVSLHGNIYGEIGAMRSEHWSKVRIGDSRYSDGLATEIDQLVNDPIVQHLFGQDVLTGDNVALTKDWLLTDPEGQRLLDTIAKAIGEQDPMTAAAFREGGE